MGYPSFGDRYATVDEHALALAVTRCRELLTILDREHTVQQMYVHARAVRVEIGAMASLLPTAELAEVPPLAKPSGEQTSLI